MAGKPSANVEDAAPSDRQRLDKWIWFARFLRSRESAADLVRRGYVRIAGRRVTEPGHFVKIGDVLTLALPGRTRVVRILGFAERRGGKESAARLHEEISGPGGPA